MTAARTTLTSAGTVLTAARTTLTPARTTQTAPRTMQATARTMLTTARTTLKTARTMLTLARTTMTAGCHGLCATRAAATVDGDDAARVEYNPWHPAPAAPSPEPWDPTPFGFSGRRTDRVDRRKSQPDHPLSIPTATPPFPVIRRTSGRMIVISPESPSRSSMKSEFLDRFDRQQLPQQAAWHWAAGSDVHHVQDSESFVYRVTIDGRDAFLRITHAEQRPGAMIRAELEFVQYLVAEGVAVARPLPSASGAVLETVRVGDQVYYACVFAATPGAPLSSRGILEEADAVQNWGRLMARMHAKATSYHPTQERRYRWNEDDVWQNALTYLPESDDVARAEWQSLNDWMSQLPTSGRGFGLIHGDLCVANFRVADGSPTAFDLDDCCYHWHVYDMVCALAPQVVRPAEQRHLIRARFTEGYAREFKLDHDWQELFDQFMRVRGVYLYVLNHRNWNGDMAHHPKRGFLDFLHRTFENPVRW